MNGLRFAAVGAALPLAAPVSAAPVRVARSGLSFAERRRSQEIMERIDHGDRAGTTGSFEDAVSRQAIKGKIARLLEAEALLAARTGRALPTADLAAELSRVVMETRDQEGLREPRAASAGIGALLSGGGSFSPAGGVRRASRGGTPPDARYGLTTLWRGRQMPVRGGTGGPSFAPRNDGGACAPPGRLTTSHSGSF